MRTLLRTLVLPVLACIAACSSGPEPTPSDGFSADAMATTKSASGALQIEVRSAPQPALRGSNSIELSVTRASDGEPVDGLSITVVPWMPAMDHGSSVGKVDAMGRGKYLVSDVYTYMPGTWVLQTTFSGPVSDHADPSLSVP